MKNINIMMCIFGLLSIALLNADARCKKYGIGANKHLYHVECHCNCAQHAQAGRAKCKECGHYNAPKVYSPRASRASSNS